MVEKSNSDPGSLTDTVMLIIVIFECLKTYSLNLAVAGLKPLLHVFEIISCLEKGNISHVRLSVLSATVADATASQLHPLDILQAKSGDISVQPTMNQNVIG